MAEPTRTSSPLLIAAAWAIVVLPTAWGLSYTARNAMAIVHATAPSGQLTNPPAR